MKICSVNFRKNKSALCIFNGIRLGTGRTFSDRIGPDQLVEIFDLTGKKPADSNIKLNR
jgi:hypothetical protein